MQTDSVAAYNEAYPGWEATKVQFLSRIAQIVTQSQRAGQHALAWQEAILGTPEKPNGPKTSGPNLKMALGLLPIEPSEWPDANIVNREWSEVVRKLQFITSLWNLIPPEQQRSMRSP